MGRRVTVTAQLEIEITDELELAEAGYRLHRQIFGLAVDAAEPRDIDPAMQALVDAVASTPEMALTTLLGSRDGPLQSMTIPGAHVVGCSVQGPQIGG